MAEEEEQGFTFVDKRRAVEEAPVASETLRTGQSPMESSDEEPSHGGHPGLGIRDRLLMCLDILQQGAWISMGAAPDPTTGEITRDIKAARIAIDSVDQLSKQIQPLVDHEVWNEIQGLLSELRMQFVQAQAGHS